MIKQRILIIVLCCFAGSWVMAQGGANRGQVKGVKSEMTEETKSALNLSAKQRAELDALQAETAKALETARQGDGDKAAAMREIKAADQARVEEILTQDQLATLRNMSMDRKDDRRTQMEEGDRERVRPEAEQQERVRTRPEETDQESVRTDMEQKDEVRTRPEEKDRERVRTDMEQKDRVRTRPEEKDRERVRTEGEQRDRVRTRPERTDRRSQMSEADRESMRQEISGYQEKNVDPVLQAQRKKLDAVMSAEDKESLKSLRSQYASEGNLQNADQNEALVAMVRKYDSQIVGLLTELEPMEAQWKADKAAIRAKYGSEESTTKRSRPEGELESRRPERFDLDTKLRFLLRNANERSRD
jgi:hypothetical protein